MDKGIWIHKEIRKAMKVDRHLSLGEGSVPIDKIDNNTFLFRDDLNPSGSWKDRGTAWKLTELLSNEYNTAVISSSGNAAISILHYIKMLSIDFLIKIVVSDNINTQKKKILENMIADTPNELYLSRNARNLSASIAAEGNVKLIRSSTDNELTKAYWSLGFEIYEFLRDKKPSDWNIYCPVSSGTGFVGMAEGLFAKLGSEDKMPRLVACQTQSTHPIVDSFTNILSKSEENQNKSLADAIVDKTVLRSYQIIKVLKQTNGNAVIVDNSTLKSKMTLLGVNYDLSYTSLLGFGAIDNDQNEDKRLYNLIIATGR